VLFVTDYTENAVLDAGRLRARHGVMTKPFAVETVAVRIRSMIEAKREDARARSTIGRAGTRAEGGATNHSKASIVDARRLPVATSPFRL
jgi:hypothetical protein